MLELKISDEQRGVLLATLKKGSDRSQACQAAGIERAHLEACLVRGVAEPPEEPFCTLFDDVEIAEGCSDAEDQMIIYAIGSGGHLAPYQIERLRAASPELDWRALANRVEAHERERVSKGMTNV